MFLVVAARCRQRQRNHWVNMIYLLLKYLSLKFNGFAQICWSISLNSPRISLLHMFKVHTQWWNLLGMYIHGKRTSYPGMMARNWQQQTSWTCFIMLFTMFHNVNFITSTPEFAGLRSVSAAASAHAQVRNWSAPESSRRFRVYISLYYNSLYYSLYYKKFSSFIITYESLLCQSYFFNF
jgi:hypothetical protein